jgi:hypothetical protein
MWIREWVRGWFVYKQARRNAVQRPCETYQCAYMTQKSGCGGVRVC